MAKLIINRSEPFTRGDQSVQILLDGKPAGILLSQPEIAIEVPEGRHTLQATMNGLKGAAQEIRVSGYESVRMHLSGTRLRAGYWWEAIAFILLMAIPDDLLSGYMVGIKSLVFAVILGYVAYRWKKEHGPMLKLEPLQGKG